MTYEPATDELPRKLQAEMFSAILTCSKSGIARIWLPSMAYLKGRADPIDWGSVLGLKPA